MIIALVSLMKLSEHSLSEFLEAEPDIYHLADLKVRYDWTDPVEDRAYLFVERV